MVRIFIDLCPLLDSCLFEGEGRLLDNHVDLLLGQFSVRVGPSVGKRELQSTIGL